MDAKKTEKNDGLSQTTHNQKNDGLSVEAEGTEAWRRLKDGKNWDDWVKVGKALQVGRQHAMRTAHTNEPQGKNYSLAFNEWLERHELSDMDKGTRSRLLDIMDKLEMIEEWRQSLEPTKRLTINHPN